MKKNEFLSALRASLTGIPAEDAERALDYYSEMIDDCMEDGMSEDEAVEQLGSVEQAAASIMPDMQRKASAEKAVSHDAMADAQYTNEPFRSIRIEEQESDVVFIPSDDGVCTVDWCEKLPHTAEVIGGVLTVRRLEDRSRFWRVKLRRDEAKLFVRLPAGEYDELYVSTACGDIRVPSDYAFERANISSASGDIDFSAAVRVSLRAKAVSGDLRIADVGAGDMELGAVSGDVALTHAETEGRITVKTVSGDIELKSVSCVDLLTKTVSGDTAADAIRCSGFRAETISGDLNASGLIADGLLEFTGSSGDAKLNACDGGSIRMRSSSGDIRGSLLSGKQFRCVSRSGDVSVPASTQGGVCDVATASGSIRLTVK